MKRLQTRAAAAALSALLLTADCMHFTQTRIATIDSFPVLFMMVMFLFMARWMQMSFYHQKLWKTLVPLFFSGVFMGLAIASKWIGCYGAVGLAVLFFSRFITLYKQSVYAKRYRNEDPAFARAADSFVQNGAATLAVPVKDTIKVAAADGTVCATPERSTLRAIQTPQVFRLSLYKEALCLAKNAGKQYTDDCQLIEAAGGKVYLTPGDYKNIKITTPEDLLVAEAFAAEK